MTTGIGKAYEEAGGRESVVAGVQSVMKAGHIKTHKLLHKCLDELVADWITHTEGRPSANTVLDLMTWSCTQLEDPTEKE